MEKLRRLISDVEDAEKGIEEDYYHAKTLLFEIIISCCSGVIQVIICPSVR
jgi:hypothetical protein